MGIAASEAAIDRGSVWLKVSLGLFLALIAWPWIRITVSDWHLEAEPENALRWWPLSGAAAMAHLDSVARTGSSGDRAQTETVVRAVLSHAPLHGKLYAAMASAKAQQGHLDDALELYRIASLRAPRDKPTRIWLVENLAARGEHAEALGHVDQLIRQAPRQSHYWTRYLDAYAGSPQGRPALVELLGASAPPWRESFLRRLLSTAAAADYFDAVVAPLRNAVHPLTAAERDAWVSRLIREARMAEAYFLWVEGLQDAEKAVSANVHDGGFELPPDNGGFGWHWKDVKGAFIGAEFTPGATGDRALSVEFAHRRVPFNHVWQDLMLPPARYRLSGRARLERLDTNEGLRWEILCAGKRTLAQTQPFRGDQEWKRFEVDFEVPPDGCPDVRLRLSLNARVPAESWIGGRAWFDDLSVVRVGLVVELEAG